MKIFTSALLALWVAVGILTGCAAEARDCYPVNCDTPLGCRWVCR